MEKDGIGQAWSSHKEKPEICESMSTGSDENSAPLGFRPSDKLLGQSGVAVSSTSQGRPRSATWALLGGESMCAASRASPKTNICTKHIETYRNICASALNGSELPPGVRTNHLCVSRLECRTSWQIHANTMCLTLKFASKAGEHATKCFCSFEGCLPWAMGTEVYPIPLAAS